MNRENNILVLRVKEKSGNVIKYQKQLYEARVLGIEEVLFIFEVEHESNLNYRADFMAKKLVKTCEILGLRINHNIVSWAGETLFDTTIGSKHEDGRIKSFNSLTFEEFVNLEENKQKLSDNDVFGNVLVKKLGSKSV